jgi:hypothetical protein
VKTKKKIDTVLLIGLGIPVVMIAIIAAAICVPRYLSGIEDPRYDFLYAIGYAEKIRTFVEDGRLCQEEVEAKCVASISPVRPELQFFVHRVGTNTSDRLTFEQASELCLDATAFSPDGYEIVHGRRSELLFPMWSSRDYRTRYLMKDGRAIKLELEIGEGFRYANNMTFLGWIEE